MPFFADYCRIIVPSVYQHKGIKMATIQKRGNKYRAIVRKKGITETATFTLKRDAEKWAREREIKIEKGEALDYEDLSFAVLIRRYVAEVTPSKKGYRSETLMLNRFLREVSFVNKSVKSITRVDIVNWKEQRLKQVKPATVKREWGTLSSVYNHSVLVWGLDLPPNPFKAVKRPKASPARYQRITHDDCQKLLDAFGYESNRPPKLLREYTAWALLFAIETGMRAGEICKLDWQDVIVVRDGMIAHLSDTKNGSARDVPLSAEARRLWKLLPTDTAKPMRCEPRTLDATYRKYRPDELRHINFHDSRHEALTRMAKKIPNPMDLAKISGHKDLNILLNVYYNPDKNDLIKLVD